MAEEKLDSFVTKELKLKFLSRFQGGSMMQGMISGLHARPRIFCQNMLNAQILMDGLMLYPL